jgi:hypothetical protein
VALIVWAWPKRKDEKCDGPYVELMSEEERRKAAARAQ